MKNTEKQSKNSVKGRNGGTLYPIQKGDRSKNPTGRPKGSLNRSTIVRKFLDAQSKVRNPITGKEEKMTQEERMTLSMIYAATSKYNVAAYKELIDNKYGKQREENLNFIHQIDFSKLSTQQLRRIQNGEDPIEVLINEDKDPGKTKS